MNTIEASGNALKLSYLRFVSDSAPGLILVLVLGAMHINGLLPFAVFPNDPSFKTFAAVTVLLLATPLGLLINGVGYFLLGGIQQYIDRMCFHGNWWPLKDSRTDLLVDQWTEYFGVRDHDWPRVVCEIAGLIETFVPELTSFLEPVRALKRFCRSLSFLTLGSMFAAAGKLGGVAAGVLFLGFTIRVVASGRRSTWPRAMGGVIVGLGFVIACFGCSERSTALAVGLVLTAWTLIVLAGMVEFHQRALTMQLFYQLLMKRGETFDLAPDEVGKRLAAFVRTRANPPIESQGV